VLASLPLTSLLAMIWLWRDTGDQQRVAELATSTFWFFLPSMPLFLVLPALLKHGLSFWAAMIVAVVGTLLLYSVTYWAAPRMGIRL
jgi:cytosine/uracil/thiamine/allantoin permease